MAYEVEIHGYSKDGSIVFNMKPSWWSSDRLIRDDRFKSFEVNRGYLDYGATLSVEEMRILHENFKNDAKTGIYSSSEWQKIIKSDIEELDAVLYEKSRDYSKFSVDVNEWESGF